MNRSFAAVLALFTGCAHRAVPVAAISEPVKAIVAAPSASPDAIAEVKEALQDVTVRFEFDRDVLDESGMRSLQKLAKVLRKHPAVRIQIAGNADERGTEEYNMLLGQRRAESARHYLWVLGVTDEQLDTVSFGDELPLALEATEEAFAVNRRDDLTVKRDDAVANR